MQLETDANNMQIKIHTETSSLLTVDNSIRF